MKAPPITSLKKQIPSSAFYVPQNGDKPQTGYFLRAELPQMMKQINDIIKQATEVRAMWKGGKSHPPLDRLATNDHCRFCRFCRFTTKCGQLASAR